jgi:hypothetical protein
MMCMVSIYINSHPGSLGPFSGGIFFGIFFSVSGYNSAHFEWYSIGYIEWLWYDVSWIILPFGNVLRWDKILLSALRCPSLGDMSNILISEVAYFIIQST